MKCEFCEKADFSCFSTKVDRYGASVYLAGGSYRYPKDKQFKFCPECGEPLAEPQPLTLDKAINGYTDMLNAMGADTAEFIGLVETVNLVARARETERFNKIFDRLCEHRDRLYPTKERDSE